MSGTRAAIALTSAAFALIPTFANAGGLVMPTAGVRATGRAGAFVAGADDGSALWFNPAGLAHLAGGKSKTALYFDVANVEHPITYERVDSGGNLTERVENDPQRLPHPFIIGSFDLGDAFVLSAGLMVPYASLDGYPEEGAQRYQLVSLHHTVLSYAEVALGWKLSKQLSLGFGLSNLIVGFSSRVVFSSCPSEIACAPEDPDWDALGEMKQQDLFVPAVTFGLQYAPSKKLTLGLMGRTPHFVDAEGTVRVRLPATGFFDGASVVGDGADMAMTFPALLRFGVEARPSSRVRAELALAWEMWSMHEEIVITPRDIRIEDQAGVGIYELGPIAIPRYLKDTFALSLGVEAQPLPRLPLDVRAGYAYENGSAPDAYMSLISPDSNKHLFSLGVGYRAGSVRIDAVFAHAAVATRTIGLDETCLPQQNPIRTGEDPTRPPCEHPDPPEPDHLYVGAGTYESSWTVVGLGVNVDL